MTKDQMRALLADLVPAAIADGRAYVVRRSAGSTVRELPDTDVQVQTKPVRPMRTFPRQGVMGAGFAVPTFKPLQGAKPYDVPYEPRNVTAKSHPIYFCARCDCHGPDCTC